MGLEFREGVADAGAGHIHLVERLHGGEAGGGTLGGFCHDQSPWTLRLMRRTASAASTAPPPLFISPTLCPSPRLRVILDRQDAVGERNTKRDRQVHERPRAFTRHDIVMSRFAANDAAQGHHGVVGFAALFRRFNRDGDRRGNFEGSVYRQHVHVRLRGFGGAFRAPQKLVRDVIVKPRLHDKDAGSRHGRAGSDFGVRCDHEATGSAWQDLILRRAAGSSRRIVPAL